MLILLYSFFNPEARELRTEMRNSLASKQYPTRIFCSFGANAHYRFPLGVNIIRAWDTPKIAVCPNTGCACCSLKSQYPQIMMTPLFRKRGHFSSPILKKRKRNVRCIIEVFLKISRSFFRTQGKNMSVCYMEGKFFALPPNLQKFCPL